MNVLVFRPDREMLTYTYFTNGEREPIWAGRIGDYRVSKSSKERLVKLLRNLHANCSNKANSGGPEAIAIRIPFGGLTFGDHAIAGSQVIKKLENLIPQAPLHLPPILALIDSVMEVFYGIPAVLVFETAFFTRLPQREYLYGLDPGISRHGLLRRYGFHGIFHDAACTRVSTKYREIFGNGVPRILSVCLETRPELSAAIGRRAVTVTSGVTPLEGLPGKTTSGELDSSIILTLSHKMNWNAKRINSVLTKESGLHGLVGSTVNLQDVFCSKSEDVRLARELIRYRILLASGAGAAAMGGVDHIVFSGRYASIGEILGPWLESILPFREELKQTRGWDCWSCFPDSSDRILADCASVKVLAVKSQVS